MFYAQSTITVISGRYTFCRYTITVKIMSVLKTYTYSDIYLKKNKKIKNCKKWVNGKLFSIIYILCFLKSTCTGNTKALDLFERSCLFVCLFVVFGVFINSECYGLASAYENFSFCYLHQIPHRHRWQCLFCGSVTYVSRLNSQRPYVKVSEGDTYMRYPRE